MIRSVMADNDFVTDVYIGIVDKADFFVLFFFN